MGAWAEAHLAGLNDQELREYEAILNLETIDLYNLATGKEAPGATPPPGLENSRVLQNIKTFVASSPLGRADPKAYEKVKKTMSN